MYTINKLCMVSIHQSVGVYIQVAAHVKTDDGEEQWILAVVNSYNSHSHKYGSYL